MLEFVRQKGCRPSSLATKKCCPPQVTHHSRRNGETRRGRAHVDDEKREGCFRTKQPRNLYLDRLLYAVGIDFRFEPPRGAKKQISFIVSTDILSSSDAKNPVSFIVDSVMPLHRDDVPRS